MTINTLYGDIRKKKGQSWRSINDRGQWMRAAERCSRERERHRERERVRERERERGEGGREREGRREGGREFLVGILQTAHLWANTGVVLESCPSLG